QDGGPEVAVKTVIGVSDATALGIRREVRALKRLRHPGIVRIVDAGEHHGLPWYAMDLVPGETLGALLERHGGETRSDWWTRTLDAERWAAPGAASAVQGSGVELLKVLQIGRALCDALAHLHGEGLVHRDLKPENIILRDGTEPVVVDFGLASVQRARSREELNVRWNFAGTAAYMAPEIIRGDAVDARADLYALGCILYELATGRRPFAAFTVNAMLRGHLELVPSLPSAHSPSLPDAFDALIANLLAKDPRERIGHADDVGHMLEELGATEPGWAAPPARPYLYRPAFVGRAMALQELEDALERTREGAGALRFVAGESGIGKTRLVNELGLRAARSRTRVLQGECPSHGGSPLHAFRGPLERLADACLEDAAQSQAIFGATGAVLAQVVPSLRNLPGIETAAPPELRGAESRARLFEALATTVTKASAAGPLLLVLDDLQWADALTYDALRYLAREVLPHAPVLVVGTFRSDEAPSALSELATERTRLNRLGEGDVQRLVQDMLAHSSDRIAEYVNKESNGNPFFVAEYLLATLEAGLLKRDARGGWSLGTEDALAVPLPRGLRALIARRLSDLSAAARRALAAAAVLEDFDLPTLVAVAELNGNVDAVDELARRHVLIADEGPLRFAHDKLREAAYAELNAEARRSVHRRAAVALQDRATPDVLGHHWRGAGEDERAIDAFVSAAGQALARGAHRHAVGRFRDAEALAPAHDSRRANWEVGIGEAMMGLGDFEAGRERLLSSLARRGDAAKRGPAFALGVAAQVARQAGARLKRRTLNEEDALGMARAYQRLVETYWFDSDLPRMLDAALRSLNAAESAPASPELARAYATMAVAAGGIPLHGVARRYVRLAKDASETVGDPAASAYVHFIVSVYGVGVAAWDTLDADLRHAAELCLAIGDRRFHGESQTVMGMSRLYRGDFAAARDHFEGVVQAGHQFENLQHRAWGALGLAECELRKRSLTAAARALDLAREEFVVFPQPAEQFRLEGLAAAVHLAAGERESAIAAAERALEFGRKLPVPTAHYLLEGYASTAEVLVELDPSSSNARLALGRMQLFAAIFPIGVPRSRWLWGRWLGRHGRGRLAAAAFRASKRSALRLKMDFEARRQT
ncbi:MAG: AAA family ATPase, partial [Myxococcota bacterium]